MSLRGKLATQWLSAARLAGRILGCEIVVEASEHSLKTKMEVPSKEERAWDSSLYKRGQLYIQGYANPVRLEVDSNPELDDPDRGEVAEGESGERDTGNPSLITSDRYQSYMRQDLISQLLTPREQWRMVVYAIIGVGVLQFLTIAFIAYNSGGVPSV